MSMARGRTRARPIPASSRSSASASAAAPPIDIFGDGGQTRDFIYVGDVVTALLAAMRLRPSDAPVFNVCTGIATSVLELARTIAELAGNTLDVRYRPPRAGEIRHSTGSRHLSRATLSLPEPVTAACRTRARCWTGSDGNG